MTGGCRLGQPCTETAKAHIRDQGSENIRQLERTSRFTVISSFSRFTNLCKNANFNLLHAQSPSHSILEKDSQTSLTPGKK